MFDIGLLELLVVLVVGLVVIGPERLPETVRTIALWIGRFKRSFQNARTDFEREIGADEVRRQLHNEAVMQSLRETKQDIEDLEDDLEYYEKEQQALHSAQTESVDSDVQEKKPAHNSDA